MSHETEVLIRLTAVIVAVTDEEPRVLTVQGPSEAALPFGPLDPAEDATLELGLRRWVREQAVAELGHVEQLYTFGDRDRELAEPRRRLRVLSVAYLALLQEAGAERRTGAAWQDWYRFLPWEDWREGRPPILDRQIIPALAQWVEAAASPLRRGGRSERAEIAFGFGGASWDGERVLERYELLYEAGLVREALRDRGPEDAQERPLLGLAMAFDHRRILATALGRLRGKLRYRPVVFELLPSEFTLFRLQRLVEALAGVRLHKGNFRRLVESTGLVEGTGRVEGKTGGRPAELFRFRREVLRERPASGVGLPRA